MNIQKNIQKKENKYLEKISKNYIEYINDLNFRKKSSSKNFYIIISNNNLNPENYKSNEILKTDLKEKFFKLKECLYRCGNSVYEINNKNEIIKILYSFFNTRKNINNLKNERSDFNF